MSEIHSENPYLIDDTGVDYEIDPHKRFTVPQIIMGSSMLDDGNYNFTPEELDEFLKREPAAEKYIRPLMGSDEFINNKLRYCLWLVDCSPNELKKMPLVYERVRKVRQYRLSRNRTATRKAAEKPSLFAEIRQPTDDYILIPKVSSELRRYIPMGFLTPEYIIVNTALVIPNADLFLFGILTSNVHMAWMRVVGGRRENRYQYSATIVYNNFAFINADSKRRAKIEAAAQAILDARAKYPDSSLADLYDENIMPYELRQAHKANDAAVMDAYGYPADWNETQIVTDLLYRYEALANGNDLSKIAATTRRKF